MRQSALSILRRARAGNVRKLAPALLLTAFAVSGCASLSGMQEPITASDVSQITADGSSKSKIVCPTDDQYTAYSAKSDGTEKRDYRDRVVAECVAAIDSRYKDFKSALREESVTSNLVTDVLGLGLGGAAAVTKSKTSKQFTQGSLAVIGIGSDIDKDVYFKQTLPAVEASMDANRDKILANIVSLEKADGQGTNYPLAQASFDLQAYQDAGDLDMAISELTKTASNDAADAKDTLDLAQAAKYISCGLSPQAQTQVDAIAAGLKKLNDPADRKKLNDMAKKVGVTTTQNEDLGDIQVAIYKAVDLLVHGSCDQSQQGKVAQAITDSFKPDMP
jgi:hypothetical protein